MSKEEITADIDVEEDVKMEQEEHGSPRSRKNSGSASGGLKRNNFEFEYEKIEKVSKDDEPSTPKPLRKHEHSPETSGMKKRCSPREHDKNKSK